MAVPTSFKDTNLSLQQLIEDYETKECFHDISMRISGLKQERASHTESLLQQNA